MNLARSIAFVFGLEHLSDLQMVLKRLEEILINFSDFEGL
jgi:hypothetical protein